MMESGNIPTLPEKERKDAITGKVHGMGIAEISGHAPGAVVSILIVRLSPQVSVMWPLLVGLIVNACVLVL